MRKVSVRALTRSLLFLFAAANDTSCSKSPDRDALTRKRADNHVIVMQIDQLRGKCYAPHSYRFNGALELYDFKGVNRWIVTPVGPDKVDNLAAMLAAPRAMIRTGRIRLFISKDAIIARPSYFQFVAFPCYAPTSLRHGVTGVDIVSMSFDLPVAYPPGYRPRGKTPPTPP